MYGKKVLVFCLLAIAALAPALIRADEKKSSAPLVHVVIFQLKADAPADAADTLIRDAHDMLAKIPSVREIAAGKPAAKTGFARNDYQIGLLVRFENEEGLKTYEKHPLHLQYVKKHIGNVQIDKLMVYDFVDQKK